MKQVAAGARGLRLYAACMGRALMCRCLHGISCCLWLVVVFCPLATVSTGTCAFTGKFTHGVSGASCIPSVASELEQSRHCCERSPWGAGPGTLRCYMLLLLVVGASQNCQGREGEMGAQAQAPSCSPLPVLAWVPRTAGLGQLWLRKPGRVWESSSQPEIGAGNPFAAQVPPNTSPHLFPAALSEEGGHSLKAVPAGEPWAAAPASGPRLKPKGAR